MLYSPASIYLSDQIVQCCSSVMMGKFVILYLSYGIPDIPDFIVWPYLVSPYSFIVLLYLPSHYIDVGSGDGNPHSHSCWYLYYYSPSIYYLQLFIPIYCIIVCDISAMMPIPLPSLSEAGPVMKSWWHCPCPSQPLWPVVMLCPIPCVPPCYSLREWWIQAVEGGAPAHPHSFPQPLWYLQPWPISDIDDDVVVWPIQLDIVVLWEETQAISGDSTTSLTVLCVISDVFVTDVCVSQGMMVTRRW